jgi:hypothetical protein
MEINVPYNYEPREYQLPLFEAIDSGVNRAVCVWHRRAGKDKSFINITAKKALERVGTYYYYFPTATMGRKILWDGMDKAGMRFLDHFPNEIISKKNDQEMRLKFINGSAFQIIGTDRLDVVGTNPVGCVFSEFSLQNPKGWDYVRPILAENGGWAIFNFTPRGKNHAYKLYQMAKGNPKWFASLLTVEDTQAITQQAIQEERDAGMSEEMILQEFYCSFDLGVEGAYYGRYINRAHADKRICSVPYDMSVPVFTFWDLGIGDAMSIVFAQFAGREIRIIDHYENQGEGFPHYKHILNEKGYLYGGHYAPHDIKVKELATGISRLDAARELGLDFTPVPITEIATGIEAARGLLNRCWFDDDKCRYLISCLQNYHKEFDEKAGVFKLRPVHDWSSHAADAFRTMAMALKLDIVSSYILSGGAGRQQQTEAIHEFNF